MVASPEALLVRKKAKKPDTVPFEGTQGLVIVEDTLAAGVDEDAAVGAGVEALAEHCIADSLAAEVANEVPGTPAEEGMPAPETVGWDMVEPLYAEADTLARATE